MAKRGRHKVRICINGHDTLITGRNKRNQCVECHRHPQPVKRILKPICPNGHDKSVVGTYKDGKCKVCVNERKRKRHEKLKVEVNARRKEQRDKDIENFRKKEQEYRDKHREEVTLRNQNWSKGHRQRINARKLRSTTDRNLREVKWSDWNKIIEVYACCPDDLEVDHILPLLGEKVTGLHVSWNLQYLTPYANRKKKNRCNLLEASEWYGKILEEAGLK